MVIVTKTYVSCLEGVQHFFVGESLNFFVSKGFCQQGEISKNETGLFNNVHHSWSFHQTEMVKILTK